MDPATVLPMMAVGYLITISIETPVLLIGVSSRHPIRNRLFAGAWLTACTYPVVWLVLPQWIDTGSQRTLYLAIAETFAPVAECFLFWLAFGKTEPRTRGATLQDMVAVTVANLASFAFGEVFSDWIWRTGP
ncbi:MAG TPA: hypothetical protein VHR66_15625 [Gemmataceae bacterium]|jgi:hypothetical protein|nr:hypothetical protein [Gemmataceae bacterium]